MTGENFFILALAIMGLFGKTQATNCTINRFQSSSCVSSNPVCGSVQTQSFFFAVCPALTDEQKLDLIISRETQKSITLEAIANSTANSINAVNAKYASAKTASQSFGYIAGISMGLFILVPVLLDLHKFYLYMKSRK